MHPFHPFIWDWYVFNKFAIYVEKKYHWNHSNPKCFFQPSMFFKSSVKISVFPDFSAICQFSLTQNKSFPDLEELFCTFPYHLLTCGNSAVLTDPHTILKEAHKNQEYEPKKNISTIKKYSLSQLYGMSGYIYWDFDVLTIFFFF